MMWIYSVLEISVMLLELRIYRNRSNFHSTNISWFDNLVSIHDLIFTNQQLRQ